MRSLAIILSLVAALILSGCGAFGTSLDETRGWSAKRLYEEAKSSMAGRDYDMAVQYYELLEARFPYGRYAQQAKMDIAYAYWKAGENENALAACDRFIKMYPNHANIDYVYYLRGLINFNEDRGFFGIVGQQDMTERDPKGHKDAFDSFREIVTRFPNSKYAPDSMVRMKYLVTALASLEVHVARYYLRRGAYLAAINRAQYTIEHYPEAPINEEALFIIIKAYDALGMTELRDDAERIMRKNFPNSVYYTRGLKRHTPWWRLW